MGQLTAIALHRHQVQLLSLLTSYLLNFNANGHTEELPEQTGDCRNRSGQIPFVLPNPQPLSITHEVSGADILIHINYTETLKTGTSPTLANWNTIGLTAGSTPDSITVLANEIRLTYATDSVSGTVKVSQTVLDDAAKTATGIQVGLYTETTAPSV